MPRPVVGCFPVARTPRLPPVAPPALPHTVRATRYVEPLREGGSLPALVEADDDGLYVVKFRGAGQGPKALIAELVAGALARAAGLPVPELAFVELDPALAQAEPDPEIQDLLRASGGLNMGLDFLPGSLAFDPAADPEVDPALAADVVWLDALVTNVDRTPPPTCRTRPSGPSRASPSTSCCPTPVRSPRPTRAWRRCSAGRRSTPWRR